MAFLCTNCGACCLAVDQIKELKHLAKEDGRCQHLQPDNACEIYETRPLMCRVDEGREEICPWIPEHIWYRMCHGSCIVLQERHGIHERFRAPIDALYAIEAVK